MNTSDRPADRPAKASVVSGYFNPLHPGHLDLFEGARARSPAPAVSPRFALMKSCPCVSFSPLTVASRAC